MVLKVANDMFEGNLIVMRGPITGKRQRNVSCQLGNGKGDWGQEVKK